MTRNWMRFPAALWISLLLFTSGIFPRPGVSSILPARAANHADPGDLTGGYSVYLPMAKKDLAWWKPKPGLSFQIQFSSDTQIISGIRVYDVDMFDTPAETIAELHARGAKVICYISMGSVESWRPDAAKYPPEVIGKEYAGWPNERWVDIRQINLLAPILRARLDLCKRKGFDAVDPDNIGGYQHDTGFPLTYADQLRFNRWLASEAHARGLSIGLKNDLEQLADLLPYYDWTLVESCFYWKECAAVRPFIHAGKAVFQIEYMESGVTASEVCAQAVRNGFTAIFKRRSLDAYRAACPLP